MKEVAVRPFGDRAILVEFANELSALANGQARALAHGMHDVRGVQETIPTLRSALIVIDALQTDRDAIAAAAVDLAHRPSPKASHTGRVIEVPVVYGGQAGPDLDEVATALNLSLRELISLHAGGEYTVYMLGFTPGFPYLGLLPEPLRVSRLATPRTRVPAGSVGIADAMSGVYPLQTPGGWRLIGRTPLRIYDPLAADPTLFQPGDRVRFVRVDDVDFPSENTAPSLDKPVHPAFEVLEPGLFTTVQDLGRPGYRHLGMPASGAIDFDALRVANILVGNEPDAPAIECTTPGPALRMLDERWIALAGADLTATLDGTEIELCEPIRIRAGQEIRFGAPRKGTWVYLAFSGGIEAKATLGSAATYAAGRVGRRLARGDVLGVNRTQRRSVNLRAPEEVMRIPESEIAIRVIPGPQEAWFDDDAHSFYDAVFRVTVQSDRAGIRLDGPPIPRREQEMLSDAMLPGAIQVPPDGKPIVILADGPTTGGYPKIGVVATADLPLLGQSRPGTRVRFVKTTVEQAIAALRERQIIIRELEQRARTE
jgi:KipI family sensor histidine kinase inhibitor